ncbi:hypothetical protein CCVT_1727 [Campylobacter curvus]|nr:hypothetical protein CCVT_1727 [Campylobacter curvus]
MEYNNAKVLFDKVLIFFNKCFKDFTTLDRFKNHTSSNKADGFKRKDKYAKDQL